MKKSGRLAIILSFVLALSLFTGCTLVKVNEKKDRQLVIAKVNGEEIKKADLLDMYFQYAYYYGLTEDTAKTADGKTQAEELKNSILTQLIDAKLQAQEAEKNGFKVTDELKAEARKDMEEQLNSSALSAQEAEEAAKASPTPEITAAPTPTLAPSPSPAPGQTPLPSPTVDPSVTPEPTAEPTPAPSAKAEYLEKAKTEFQTYLDGKGITEDQYIEEMARQKATDLFKVKVESEVKVEDTEVTEYHNTNLQTQKDAKGAGSFDVVLYDPAGKKVQMIEVKFTPEQQSVYDGLVEEKPEEAEAMITGTLQDSANTIYGEVQKSTDFKAMVDLYNMGEVSNRADGSYGFDIKANNGDYTEEFVKAVMELKVGDISKPILNEQSYFIVKVDEDIPETTYALDTVKDDIKTTLENTKKETLWTDKLKEWTDSAKIEKYTNNMFIIYNYK